MEQKSEEQLFRRAVVLGGAVGLCAVVAIVAWQGTIGSRRAPGPGATSPPALMLRREVAAIFARTGTGASRADQMPLSPGLIADKAMLRQFLDIAGAKDVRPQVDAVHGRTVDLTIRYALVSDTHVAMLFTRRDSWTFAHGNTGWLLDRIAVNDKVFDAIVYPDGARDAISDSRYDPATGSVSFAMHGGRYVWVPDERWGWKIAAVTTAVPVATHSPMSTPVPSPSWVIAVTSPSPSATASPRPTPSPRPTTSPRPSTSRRPTTSPRPTTSRPTTSPRPSTPQRPVVVARAAPTRKPAPTPSPDPYGTCAPATIDTISDDASVVTLSDGRRFLVPEPKRYLVSLWGDDNTLSLCDPGAGPGAKLVHGNDVVIANRLPSAHEAP